MGRAGKRLYFHGGGSAGYGNVGISGESRGTFCAKLLKTGVEGRRELAMRFRFLVGSTPWKVQVLSSAPFKSYVRHFLPGPYLPGTLGFCLT